MAAELWRLDSNNFALYIDVIHDQEVKKIKRSRPHWTVMATYQKGGQLVALQWRISESDYRAAKRIENRINKSVPETVLAPSVSA